MRLNIRYHKIQPISYVDGPGRRTTLFLQGCPIECPGCQNPHLWDETGGQEMNVAELATELLTVAARFQNWPEDGPAITISGGEPFAQAQALAYLVAALKSYGCHIILYTGFVWEDLLEMCQALPEIGRVLRRVDVLVDGPYMADEDSAAMQYRGSANQRVIDVQASLSDPPLTMITLDWDQPEIVILPHGNLLMTGALADVFGDIGQIRSARRCGQVREIDHA